MCRFTTEDDASECVECVLSVLRDCKHEILEFLRKRKNGQNAYSENNFVKRCLVDTGDHQSGGLELKFRDFQKCTRLRCDASGKVDSKPSDANRGPDGIITREKKVFALIEVKVFHQDRAYQIFNSVAQLKEYLLTYSLKNGILLVVDPRLISCDRQGALFVNEFCALVNELLASMLGMSLTVLWVFRTENYVVKYCIWPNIQEVIVL